MIPIYEQGQGRGIGRGIESFIKRFDEICAQHIKDKQAKAFAFIFYDFRDEDIKRILRDQGVFAQLDRLSGNNLSLFYLHTSSEDVRRSYRIRRFNNFFLEKLGIEDAKTPCVVFFRLTNDQIEDVEVVQLEHADLIHGFKELYEVVENYITKKPSSTGKGFRSLRWLKKGGGFIAVEVFRDALKHVLDWLF